MAQTLAFMLAAQRSAFMLASVMNAQLRGIQDRIGLRSRTLNEIHHPSELNAYSALLASKKAKSGWCVLTSLHMRMPAALRRRVGSSVPASLTKESGLNVKRINVLKRRIKWLDGDMHRDGSHSNWNRHERSALTWAIEFIESRWAQERETECERPAPTSN